MKFDKKVLKNWRWWVAALSFYIPVLVVLGVFRAISFVFEFVGNLLCNIGKRINNAFEIKPLHRFLHRLVKWVKKGESK